MKTASIHSRVDRLQTVLAAPDYTNPISMRFQTAEKYVTVQVAAIAVKGSTLEVTTDGGDTFSVRSELLLDIVAFSDAARRPVFLTEFSRGGDIAAEYQNSIEKEIDHCLVVLLKHQYEYLRENTVCRHAERKSDGSTEDIVEEAVRDDVQRAA